jgi:small basic protein
MNIADPQYISFLVGIVLPLLVGLVTTRVTNSGAQAVLLAALAAVSGFLSELLSDTFDLKAALLTWIGTFLVAVGTHYGFWKPTGTTAKVLDLGPRREARQSRSKKAD